MLFWHIEGHKWETNRHFYVIYSRNRLYLKIYIYAMHRPEMYMVLHFNNNNSDVLSSMVTHTRNWCSAFNPSKCAHTQQWVVNKHTHTHTRTRSSGQPLLQRPGSNWGFGACSRGIEGGESAVHSQSPPSIPANARIEPATFRLQAQLSNH